MYKICFYVPVKDAEVVKASMFEAGAGKYANYDCCSFETKGVGQFRPLQGANPTLGKINSIEKVEELKVEMICEESKIHHVISALKLAHPYEVVAYDVTLMLEF